MDADSDEERLSEEYGDTGDVGWDLGAERVYWRRRFLILCTGVVALGACAWLVPSAHSPSSGAAAEARQSVAALNERQVLPSAAYGSPWASPTPTPTPTPPSPSTAPSTAPAKLAIATKAAAAKHPGPAKGAAACAPSGIVLSLATSQARYAKGAWPSFSVYAVLTKAAACTLPFGPGAVHVVVTRTGHVVWDSSACDPAPATAVRFTLGVPQVLKLTWNPRATRPAGCGGSLAAGEWGTFDAVAMSYGQSSPVHAFKLGGLPAEGRLERLAHVFYLDDLYRPRCGTAD